MIIHRTLYRILAQFVHPKLDNFRPKFECRFRIMLPVVDAATGARVGCSFAAERVEGEMDEGL